MHLEFQCSGSKNCERVIRVTGEPEVWEYQAGAGFKGVIGSLTGFSNAFQEASEDILPRCRGSHGFRGDFRGILEAFSGSMRGFYRFSNALHGASGIFAWIPKKNWSETHQKTLWNAPEMLRNALKCFRNFLKPLVKFFEDSWYTAPIPLNCPWSPLKSSWNPFNAIETPLTFP